MRLAVVLLLLLGCNRPTPPPAPAPTAPAPASLGAAKGAEAEPLAPAAPAAAAIVSTDLKSQLARIDAERDAAEAPRRADSYAVPETNARDLEAFDILDLTSPLDAADILGFAVKADVAAVTHRQVAEGQRRGLPWRIRGRLEHIETSVAAGRALTVASINTGGHLVTVAGFFSPGFKKGSDVEVLGYVADPAQTEPTIAAFAMVKGGSIDKVRALHKGR